MLSLMGLSPRGATTLGIASLALLHFVCTCTRVGQNAQGVVEGVVKGVIRVFFRRRAPLALQLKRASVRRREEKDCRRVHMIQQVAAKHLGWGKAPSLDTK